MKGLKLAVLACAIATAADAEAPALPNDAKQLSGAEIGTWLDGKTFSVEIFDAEVPIVATTSWDLAGKKVTGSFEANGQKGTFANEWIIKGDTSCGERTPSGKLVCQKIFVLGDTMYEVTKKGVVHAVSKVK